MQPFVALLLLLAISPLTILILHAVVYRVGAALNVRLTGHASAMFAMVAGLAVVLAGSWGLVFRTWIGRPVEIALGVIYVGSVYGALALLYLVAINIAETSLHMHTLLEIAWATELSEDALLAKYSAGHMIRARLERLASLGQIRCAGDTYVLAGRSALCVAWLVDLWRRVLAMPEPAMFSKSERP